MEKNFEELEIGATYRARDGAKVGIVNHRSGRNYPFFGTNGECYTPNGIFNLDNPNGENELIEKISDAEQQQTKLESVNHPNHYGGADNPYEAIKVIEAWEANFNVGNALKYLSRAGKKGSKLEDLQKAAWYLSREIENLSK